MAGAERGRKKKNKTSGRGGRGGGGSLLLFLKDISINEIYRSQDIYNALYNTASSKKKGAVLSPPPSPFQ